MMQYPVEVLQAFVDMLLGALPAVKRLVLSIARDSAHALRSETKKYSRMNARNFLLLPPW
ncbi:MAG: hypothetical protein CAF41_004205 [Nitrospira sp. CG24A]|nr:MAG: hypothetical protein CAF41_004205 [Nitrospira sp. CG24A]